MNRVAFGVVVAAVVVAAGAAFLFRPAAPEAPRARTNAGSATTEAPRATPPGPSDPTREAAPASPPAERTPSARRPARPTPAEGASAAPAAPVAPTTATLRISSDIPGAQVFLNRQFLGATPATAEDLAPGSYQLNVSTPGFDSHVETLELTPGDREVRVTFREVRLDQSLAVVHKHRFGSCQGTLVATPDGVRYQTAHKEDAFQAPLLGLETFQIDYLSKNLRIQPRQGKRYDFTDPDGNADRLLVFHQQVERARDQLRKGDAP